MSNSNQNIIKGITVKKDGDNTIAVSLQPTSSTTNTATTINAAQTANRTITLPDATTTLIGHDNTATVTNKSIDADQNTITNIENADIKAGAAIDASKIADGSVSSTEFQYLSNVTSDIQSQINGKEPSFSTLPISKGGTNSGTALNNNRVMQSSSGAIVEAAAITASRALISDANGIPTHSATTSTELGYVSGVTSAIQTQINGKASTSLSNLASTAVNDHILPATDNSKSLGDSTHRWSTVRSYQVLTESTGGFEINAYLDIKGTNTLPSGGGFYGMKTSTNVANSLGLMTSNDSTADANATLPVKIESGNKTAGTGNSGDIILQTGTSSGGTRGQIQLNAYKLYLNAKASADPTGTNAGELYYNTTSNKFKFYNGSTWGDVGSAGASGSDGYIQFAASGVLSSDSNLYWDDTNNRLSIGAGSSPTSVIHAKASTAATAGKLERTTAGTSGIVAAQNIKATSSGDMTDGFGASILFNIEDTAATNNSFGEIGFARAGADSTGDFVVTPYTTGTGNERFRVKSDGRIYGTALHNNANAVTGTTNQYIASGIYTPTVAEVANTNSQSADQWQWIRVGNVVQMSGYLAIDADLTGYAQVSISLPIASNFTASTNASGTGVGESGSGLYQPGFIVSRAASDDIMYEFYASDTLNRPHRLIVTYEIK